MDIGTGITKEKGIRNTVQSQIQQRIDNPNLITHNGRWYKYGKMHKRNAWLQV